jgi:hypothetical protein
MAVQTEPLVKEIRALRRGRGVQADDLEKRLGPNLRMLLAEDDDPAVRRRALITILDACASHLHDDMRTAVVASLGLNGPTVRMSQLKARVEWLALQLGREYRTALRRVDAAENLLAEQVAVEIERSRGTGSIAKLGWYIDELYSLLRLDTPTPESHQRRRIIAAQDRLTEVMAWLDIPVHGDATRPSPQVEVAYGGTLVRHEDAVSGGFRYVVEFPEPLDRGQSHEYGLVLRLATKDMRPYYVFTPEIQCNVFDLRVRFDPARRPNRVRSVRGETVRTFEANKPAGEMLHPDSAGEVHVRFAAPVMYLGYGVQWEL